MISGRERKEEECDRQEVRVNKFRPRVPRQARCQMPDVKCSGDDLVHSHPALRQDYNLLGRLWTVG